MYTHTHTVTLSVSSDTFRDIHNEVSTYTFPCVHTLQIVPLASSQCDTCKRYFLNSDSITSPYTQVYYMCGLL